MRFVFLAKTRSNLTLNLAPLAVQIYSPLRKSWSKFSLRRGAKFNRRLGNGTKFKLAAAYVLRKNPLKFDAEFKLALSPKFELATLNLKAQTPTWRTVNLSQSGDLSPCFFVNFARPIAWLQTNF